ncbi:MAG: hypothetical protein ACETWM_09775 [Candidatus Lokiarchaeia archaeon]
MKERYQISNNLWWVEHQNKIYIILPSEKKNEVYILTSPLEKKIWKYVNTKSIKDIISELEDFASKKEILNTFKELKKLKLIRQTKEIKKPPYYLKRITILLSEACEEKCSWCPYWQSNHFMEKRLLNKLSLKVLSNTAMASHIAIWGGDSFSDNSLVKNFLQKLSDWTRLYDISAFWITLKTRRDVNPNDLDFLSKFKNDRMKITLAIETNIQDLKDINESILKLNSLKRMGFNIMYHAWVNNFALSNPDIFKTLEEIVLFELPPFSISTSEFLEFLLKIRKHRKMYLFMNDALSRCLTIDQTFHSNCGAGRDSIFVNSFGRIFQCYGAYRLNKDIGNILHKKISSVLKNGILLKKCINCGIQSICKGCRYPPWEFKEKFCDMLKRIVFKNVKPLIDFVETKEKSNLKGVVEKSLITSSSEYNDIVNNPSFSLQRIISVTKPNLAFLYLILRTLPPW